ncbi:MAG: cupredoxin domain-containing protein [Candidatus Saccharibacteria bacterium]|nr:cupredoxin domain-containing protein [Candidatus Saccharibacteria bacterium]
MSENDNQSIDDKISANSQTGTVIESGDGKGGEKKVGLILLVIGVLVAAGAALFMIFREQIIPVEESTNEASVAYIDITADGFVPDTLLVEPGTTVIWRNGDTEPHHVASNPYPEQTDHPELDSEGQIGPEQTYEFTVGEEEQTYNYHDANEPTKNGSITITLGDTIDE